jgi:hypothetical protein
VCTSIVEIARAEGMAKRGHEWFPLSQAVVAYDWLPMTTRAVRRWATSLNVAGCRMAKNFK